MCNFLLFGLGASAQSAASSAESSAQIHGTLLDPKGEPVSFANVVLYTLTDSSIIKVEVSADDGQFNFSNLPSGKYYLEAKYVGLTDYRLDAFDLGFGESRKLGEIRMGGNATELVEATVTAQRAIVEIKPDRTVFNVQGTINSAGGNGMSLLRKAPGVVVDNNDNIIVMGRAGVLIYIDGKRSPLAGEALVAYLQSLPAEQIDRIDIITNPGAKYEAEGNAGIIDIRLKKNENWGSNGSVSVTTGQGERNRSNASLSLNHRQGEWNTFLTGGLWKGSNYNTNFFRRELNGLYVDETMRGIWNWQGFNVKLGTDWRFAEKHTVGVMINGNYNDNGGSNRSRSTFSQLSSREQVDSLLIASSMSDGLEQNISSNFNYRFDNGAGRSINVDLDYGLFRRDDTERQPNQFFGPDGQTPRSREEYAFKTPSDIDIATATFDYEQPLAGGTVGAGGKYIKVLSDNTFRVFSSENGEDNFLRDRSNLFVYDEQVAAAYLSYKSDFGKASPMGSGKTFGYSLGIRAEQTWAEGELSVFTGEAPTFPVDRTYLNFFPSAGLTWAAAAKHTFALNYGRRINRPDYQTLNPFVSFASLVTFRKGNPALQPEIVNNFELSHTFNYRYTTKISYSSTADQITQLIRPSDTDERANFITFDNLARQEVVALNLSAPATLNKWWDIYFTGTGNYIRNQSDYPDGSSIDISAVNFNMFAQNTFKLPKGIQFEVSGWFSGPGIWGGTFETNAQGSLNLGVQKKFLADKLNVRLAADDILYTSGWGGRSIFAGQTMVGGGNWDSRQVALSLSYNFGNEKVKVRQRKTGLDEAAGRVGGGN